MLRGLAALVVTGGLVLSPLADLKFGYDGVSGPTSTEKSSVDPKAAGRTLSVEVVTSGSTAKGKAFSRSVQRSVPPLCWYEQGDTGQVYYDFWKDGGPARKSGTLDGYQAQGLLHAGYDQPPVSTDVAGHWYEAKCQFDAPVDKVAAYSLSHPPVYWEDADGAPVADAVDPLVLAQIAFEAMDLPSGEIHWNPSLPGSGATVVNMDTWVWIEDAPTNVSITATAGTTSATVAATLDHLDLTAPGADPATCKDTGVAWTKGATETSCKIVFYHSSANQLPVKLDQTLPTSTLTVTGSWTASWTSSLAPGTWTALDAQDVVTTKEIPVAEIQSLVTTGS